MTIGEVRGTEEGHKEPQDHRESISVWNVGEWDRMLSMGLPKGVQLRFDHRDEGGHSKQVGTAASSQVLCLSCPWDQSPSTCGGMLKHSLTQTFQDQKLWEIPQTSDKRCWKAQKATWEKQLELEGTASTPATWVWATHKEHGRTETLAQTWHWPTRLPFLHRISN